MKVMKKIKKHLKSLTTDLSDFIARLTIKMDFNLGDKQKTLTTILLILSAFALSLTMVGNFISFKNMDFKQTSKLRYTYQDGIRYIEIKDAYIKEELVVETGTLLPELKTYFRDDYILPDNISAQYFDGNNALALDEFTYEEFEERYLKGTRTIDVLIFGKYNYRTKLVVIDTLTPDVTLNDVTIKQNEELDLKSFVASYKDNSHSEEYAVRFKEAVNFENIGTYDINLYVCDEANNCYEGSTKLTVIENDKIENNENSNSSSNSGSTSSNNSNSGSKPNNSNSGNSKPGNSSGNENNNGGQSTPNNPPSNPKPDHDTSYSFDTKNVITPQVITCNEETKEEENFDLVVDHYGTKEITHFGYIKYRINEDCSITIINYLNRGATQIDYAYENFTGTAASMLNEAIKKYETKDNPLSGYQTTLNNFLQLTNEARSNAGLNDLTFDYHLSILATMRAMELAYSNVGYENHLRPNNMPWYSLWSEYGVSQPSKRAENIAYNFSTDKRAFDAWMLSESHKANILDKMYKKMGIGKFTYNGKTYHVELFST